MTSVLEDWSAWAGTWPFGLARTMSIEDLRAAMARYGIDRAFVSPLEAVLADDPMVANVALADAVGPDGPNSVTPVVNPMLAGWERDLNRLRERCDVRAVRLAPSWHGWAPESACAGDLLDRLAGAGCTPVVQLRLMDERNLPSFINLPPLDVPAIASWLGSRPEVPAVICGAYASELPAFAAISSVRCDLSFVESRDTIETARAVLAVDRIVLGTLMPLLEPGAGLAKLREPL